MGNGTNWYIWVKVIRMDINAKSLKFFKKKTIAYLFCIMGFISIVIAMLIICSSTASKYEISIYTAYPCYLWCFILIPLFCGIIVLLYSSFEKKSIFMYSSILLIILSNLIILLLPLFRNYFLNSFGDEVSHLGMIKDILVNGMIGKDNFYPSTHLLVVYLNYYTNIDPRILIKVIPSIFLLIYYSGIYVLLKHLKKGIEVFAFTMILASVFYYGYFSVYTLPTQFILCITPLILSFIFIKNDNVNKLSFSIIFVLLLFSSAFLHPLGSLFIIILLLLFATSTFLFNHLNCMDIHIKLNYNTLNPSILLFIVFFSWFSIFSIFNNSITFAFNSFILNAGQVPIEKLSSDIISSNLNFFDIIIRIITNYAHVICLMGLSLISTVIVIKKIIVKKIDVSLLFLSLSSLFFGLFYLATLLIGFLTTGYSTRIFNWSIMAALLLNGIIIYEYISKIKSVQIKRITIFTFLAIVLFSATIGVFSVYPAPNNGQINIQGTQQDIVGMEWFLNQKDLNYTLIIGEIPLRAIKFINGDDGSNSIIKSDVFGAFYQSRPHIGYDEEYASLGERYSEQPYLIIDEQIKSAKILRPDSGKYTANDLNRLEYDNTLNKIYSADGLEIWKVI